MNNKPLWWKDVVVDTTTDKDFETTCHFCKKKINPPLMVHTAKKKKNIRNSHLSCYLKHIEKQLPILTEQINSLESIKKQILSHKKELILEMLENT